MPLNWYRPRPRAHGFGCRAYDIQRGNATSDPCMARRNWTQEAETWLRDIYEYIAQDNPVAAARVVEGIYERAQVTQRVSPDRSSV